MSLYEASFNTLFRRCVTGCSSETPACPACATGEICQLIPPSCDACQSTTCVTSAAASSPTVTATASKSSGGGPNVGAIAGGVIGGVAAIAIATYLVWRFCIKTKRQQYEQEDWIEEREEEDEEGMAAEKAFTMRRDARASTHTVGSIASTVLTRASNIIQIAYIPGVTNRSAPSTPGLLVPPVPPIPIALSSPASSGYEDEHFFMPGDLRDSTYSGVSDRTSYARNSVASTIYGKNAIVSPVPAQTVIRGKAAVVSVKSAGGSSPGEFTPPVPSVNYDKYGAGEPPSPAFSVGSTFLNSANAATQLKSQVTKVAHSSKKASMLSQSSTPQSLGDRDSTAVTLIDDTTPNVDQGPFRDPPDAHASSSTLSAVIEEATKRAHGDVKAGLGVKRRSTPFGDEHEVRD